MNRAQLLALAKRLAGRGYVLEKSEVLTARSGKGVVHIDPSGVCWSAIDPEDVVLPIIPDVLASSKELIPLRALRSMYYRPNPSGGRTLRITTRVESNATWDELRASDECGLAPDEHAVLSFLLERSRVACGMLTDFVTKGCEVRFCGRRLYFDSRLEPCEAVGTLRKVGARASRNSYLRRVGSLEGDSLERLARDDWFDLFAELGDWCYFVPA
jgi:hypothetical protein